MAETIRQRLARWFGRTVVPKRTGQRMYSAARNGRLTVGFGTSGDSSSDAELHTSLRTLRARSRQMIRDSAYAKRAKSIVVNNVIGVGVGLQAQVMNERGELRQRVNDGIEEAWRDWCEALSCHTGGALHFSDLERVALGQVFEAGEVIVRVHFERLGDSTVPLTLEVVEAERIADDHQIPAHLTTPGARLRMGVEQDDRGRPIAYWIRRGHPGDLREQPEADRFERVPASEVFHLRIVDRWPQSRGEPWLHAVLRKLDDMNEYSSAEIQAARAASYYFGTITSPAPDNPLIDSGGGETPPAMNIEPLAIQQLAPGEQLEFHQPSRPNAALDPFMRYMLREVAAGAGPSYESLSRDYSQSNYSSSRLALLDDRDLWRTLQAWWIRSFRRPLHRLWLRQAVLARAVPAIGVEEYALTMRKFEAVLFKPRGWSWVDPTKEVNAYKEAVKAGFTTVTDVIAQTAGGMDIEDVLATRERELRLMEERGLVFDTDPAQEQEAQAPPPAAPPDDESEDDEPTTRPARVVSFGR